MPINLTEEEKAKINVEEIYRSEVRKSLEEKKKNKFISFLNSAFGIWILSSVVLGLFSYSFNEHATKSRDEGERELKIKKLNLEIESRISQFWVALHERTAKNIFASLNENGSLYWQAHSIWECFKNPVHEQRIIITMYKEYDERPTSSLMIELTDLLEDKYDLKGDFTTSARRQSIDSIKYAAAFIVRNGLFENVQDSSVSRMWSVFSANIIGSRWNKFFPYTNKLYK